MGSHTGSRGKVLETVLRAPRGRGVRPPEKLLYLNQLFDHACILLPTNLPPNRWPRSDAARRHTNSRYSAL